MIDGVQKVFESHGILGRLGSRGIRRTVNLPTGHTTAGKQHRVAPRPVIATVAGVHTWCPAKFGRDHHQRVIQHAPLIEVCQKPGNRMIQSGRLVGEGISNVDMTVPAVVADGHEPDSGFHQPPGHHQPATDRCRLAAVIENVAVPVKVTDLLRLRLQ